MQLEGLSRRARLYTQSPWRMAMDVALVLAAAALASHLRAQPLLWTQAMIVTWATGAWLLLAARWALFPSAPGGHSRWAFIALYILAAFALVAASAAPRQTEIPAGPDNGVPAQLPGPLDSWGADMPREIRVPIGGTSAARVWLFLMESHDTAPPRLAVTAGQCHLEDVQVEKGGGTPDALWESEGTESEYTLRIPRGCVPLEGGEVVFRPVTGSWIAIRGARVEQLPLRWELWRHLAEPWNCILFWTTLLVVALGHGVAARGQGMAWRRMAMHGAMWGMVILGAMGALGAAAFYVELYYPWLTSQEGNVRSKEIFRKKSIHDVKLGWRLLPGFTAYTRQTPKSAPELFYANTQEGFRALDQEKSFPARGKVMVLGDSFAQGLFLSQKETIPAVMARRLGGYVYNFGVTAFSTDQEFTTFIQWIDRVDVEWVALLFYGNDILYTGVKRGYDLPKPVYEEVDGKVDFARMTLPSAEYVEEMNRHLQPLYNSSETYCCFTDKKASVAARTLGRMGRYLALLPYPGRLYSALVEDIRTTKLTSPAVHTDVTPELLEHPEKQKKRIELIFQFLAEIDRECRQRDRRFMVVFVPDILQVYHTDKPERGNLRRMFMDLCGAHGLRCLDPSDKLAAASRLADVYFIDDGHFSPYGARIVGEMMAEFIAGKND